MRISDWSSDVCSSDLAAAVQRQRGGARGIAAVAGHVVVVAQRAVAERGRQPRALLQRERLVDTDLPAVRAPLRAGLVDLHPGLAPRGLLVEEQLGAVAGVHRIAPIEAAAGAESAAGLVAQEPDCVQGVETVAGTQRNADFHRTEKSG